MGPCAGQEESGEGPRAELLLCRGKGLSSSLGEMSREGWMGTGGSPTFTWTHWPNSLCRRASAAGQAGKPPSRSALECVFIYPSRISSVGADAGNRSCWKDWWEQPWFLAGDGAPLSSPLCAAPGTAEEVEQILPFLQRSFCSMGKHILKL